MSKRGPARASYLDLEAAEDTDSEGEVDITEEDLELINDEGDEDESDDGNDESNQGDSDRNGELWIIFFLAIPTLFIRYLLRWPPQVRCLRRCTNGCFFGWSVE
jgi:hypothetical protein